MTYLTNVAAWLSQGINCIFLAGSPDQTVSARAYVNRHDMVWGALYRVLNMIFFWQYDHCWESHMRDIEFAQQVLDL